MWHIDDILKAVRGTAVRVERDIFSHISTDSRSISEGELFIPLTGKNFDGHLFVDRAFEKSHGGTLCSQERAEIWNKVPGTVILVDDTTQALLDLARYTRERAQGIFIGITGSNGKTTTKEIAVDMLRHAFSVHYNEKNYNNLIGVSKSILAMEGTYDLSVFELGTNSRGEIQQLASVVEPDISLITNINPSHLEGLRDIEGVLEEKLDLFRFTKEGGKVLINADDASVFNRYRDTKQTILTYGLGEAADISLAIDKDLGWDGFKITILFPNQILKTKTGLLGKHNLYNILAAAAIAYAAGARKEYIRETIESFTPYSMRFKPVESGKGYLIVDDSYNANPASMAWAIKTLVELPCYGKRIAILGDMRELGDKTSYYHHELGRYLKENPISFAAVMGEEMEAVVDEMGPERARGFDDKASLVTFVKNMARSDDVILVKGSRASRMDEIVEALI